MYIVGHLQTGRVFLHPKQQQMMREPCDVAIFQMFYIVQQPIMGKQTLFDCTHHRIALPHLTTLASMKGLHSAS
jgi:hypothetical protein